MIESSSSLHSFPIWSMAPGVSGPLSPKMGSEVTRYEAVVPSSKYIQMISGRKFAALAIPIFSVRSVLFWSVSIFSVRSMLFWSVSSGSCPVASSRCSCVGVWSVVEVVVDLEKRKQPQLWFHELMWINWVRAYVSCLVILVESF